MEWPEPSKLLQVKIVDKCDERVDCEPHERLWAVVWRIRSNLVQESTGEIDRMTSIQGQTMLILIQIKLLPDKPDSMILLRRLMITQKERRVKFVWI